jgi:L-cysteine/cystine lyase
MEHNRRKFLKDGALLATGAAFLPQWLQAQSKAGDLTTLKNKTDEEFWKVIRENFPLDKNWAYLNNGTMGPSPYQVIQSQYESMLDVDTTGHYGGWQEAVPVLAKFVGANDDEICLTHNVTEGINIVCWGLDLKKGDEVIITNHEHVGNALPWLNRAKLDGIELKVLQLADTANETLNRIEKLITSKTKVIAVPHMPCTQGQVLPVKQICQLAKDKGIYSFIDGAHGPGMLQLDLHDMGCDFYASCCHKWVLASKGTGFLYVKKEKLNQLQAKWVGGYCDTGWSLIEKPTYIKGYVDSAHRFYYGSMSTPAFKGVVEAVNFHETIGVAKIEARAKQLADYFYKKLQNIAGGIEIVTPEEEQSRAAIVSFKVKKINHIDLYNMALAKGMRIRAVSENEVNCVRASFHIYNTFEEADQLADFVKKSV